MSSNNRPITGRQIAAARELLDITQRELAEAVGLLVQSLARIEATKGPRERTSRALMLIRAELERRGIEFINGRGVLLQKPGADSPEEHESAGE